MNEAKATARELSTRQKIAVVVLDVLIIAELCLAMYLASAHPDEFTPVFMKRFFAMLVPTMIAGYITVRLFREKPVQVESTQS
jgi:membrane protein CcdC involved in cytochrome C biogenesis